MFVSADFSVHTWKLFLTVCLNETSAFSCTLRYVVGVKNTTRLMLWSGIILGWICLRENEEGTEFELPKLLYSEYLLCLLHLLSSLVCALVGLARECLCCSYIWFLMTGLSSFCRWASLWISLYGSLPSSSSGSYKAVSFTWRMESCWTRVTLFFLLPCFAQRSWFF